MLRLYTATIAQLSGAGKGSNKIYKDALQTTDDKENTQITPETVDVVEIRNSQNGRAKAHILVEILAFSNRN